MKSGQVKTLAVAYWNDSVDRGSCSSTQALRWAIDNEYLRPIQVSRSERKQKLLRELGGYTEDFINKTRTVYILTDTGLDIFRITNNYKKQAPELKN